MAEYLAHVLSQLDSKGVLDWEEAFIDGSFAPAKKGVHALGKPRRAKGTKWMVVADGKGIPLGSSLASASPAEVKLVDQTLEMISVPHNGPGRLKKRPERLIGDKGRSLNNARFRFCSRKAKILSTGIH